MLKRYRGCLLYLREIIRVALDEFRYRDRGPGGGASAGTLDLADGLIRREVVRSGKPGP